MSDERKASDILLDLEAKVELLLKQSKLIDLNQKIMIDKMNSFIKDNKLNNKNSVNFVEVNENTLKKNPVKEQKSDNVKCSEVTVIQKVLYPDNSKAVLAKVKILDINDKEVKKTNVMASGDWNIILPPGEYKAHIVKAPLSDGKKPLIDRLHPFVILGDKPVMELPPSKE